MITRLHFTGGAHAPAFVLLLSALACAGCDNGPIPPETAPVALAAAAAGEAHATRGVLEVIATGLHFDAPDVIPSGWTTVRFHNLSPLTHFVALEKLPPGKTVADSKAEVLPIFQAGMDLLIAGDVSAALAKFGELPAWFFNIVFMGGPGITAPGLTSEVTVYLEPGTYVLECYVKTPGGQFHSYLGMVDQVIVSDEPSPAREPTPTIDLTVRNAGFDFDGDIRPGRHVIAVHFEEQQVNGNFVGNDVHLVRLTDGTDLDALADWMNWTLPAGLATPAPAEFVGGLEEMPAGSTGYIDAVLKPGRYAWIAEVDDAPGKNMLRTFTVPFDGSPGR